MEVVQEVCQWWGVGIGVYPGGGSNGRVLVTGDIKDGVGVVGVCVVGGRRSGSLGTGYGAVVGVISLALCKYFFHISTETNFFIPIVPHLYKVPPAKPTSFTRFPWSRYHRSQLMMMTVARSKRRH